MKNLTLKYSRETLAVTQRILQQLWRRQRNLIFWGFFPISILLLNGYILAERTKLARGEAMEVAAASSLIGAALFFSCLGGSLSTVIAEREQQTLKRLFISPLSGISYFLGIFFAHSFIGVGQFILVYLVATFLGANFNGSLLLGLLIILLSIVAYVGVGFILATQLGRRTEDVNTLVATFGIPLLISGGAFFPSAYLPKKILKIAQYNPIYHMNEALVGVWAKGKTFAKIDDHFWFIFLFAIVVFLAGWICYRHMLQLEKNL